MLRNNVLLLLVPLRLLLMRCVRRHDCVLYARPSPQLSSQNALGMTTPRGEIHFCFGGKPPARRGAQSTFASLASSDR